MYIFLLLLFNFKGLQGCNTKDQQNLRNIMLQGYKIYCCTGKVSEMVQRRDYGGARPLQEEQHHNSEGKVSDPGSRDAAGDAVSSGPAAHSEHQASHPWIELSVQVEQLCALHCHPVDNTQD